MGATHGERWTTATGESWNLTQWTSTSTKVEHFSTFLCCVTYLCDKMQKKKQQHVHWRLFIYNSVPYSWPAPHWLTSRPSNWINMERMLIWIYGPLRVKPNSQVSEALILTSQNHKSVIDLHMHHGVCASFMSGKLTNIPHFVFLLLFQDRSRMYDSLNMHSLESSLINIMRVEQDPIKGKVAFSLLVSVHRGEGWGVRGRRSCSGNRLQEPMSPFLPQTCCCFPQAGLFTSPLRA